MANEGVFGQIVQGAQAGANIKAAGQRFEQQEQRFAQESEAAGQQMQLRAVDLARKQNELETQKTQVKAAKFQQFLTKTDAITRMSPGPLRKLQQENAKRWATDIGFDVNEDWWKMIEDASLKDSIGTLTAGLLGMEDTDKFVEASDAVAPFLKDPISQIGEIGKTAAQFEIARQDKDLKERELGVKKGEILAKASDKKIDRSITIVEKHQANPTTRRTNAMQEGLSRILAAASTNASKRDSVDQTKMFEALTAQKVDTSKVTAFDDLALVFNFMKMLDPTSVVRESEFKVAAEKTTPALELGQRVWQQLLTAKILLPEMRAQLVDAARSAMVGQNRAQQKINRQTLLQAVNLGGDVERVRKSLGGQLSLGLTKVESAVQTLVTKHGMDEDQARRLVAQSAASKRKKKQGKGVKVSGTAKRSTK